MDDNFSNKEFNCLRCRWKWIPRKKNRPRQCPKCKTAWWDTKK